MNGGGNATSRRPSCATDHALPVPSKIPVSQHGRKNDERPEEMFLDHFSDCVYESLCLCFVPIMSLACVSAWASVGVDTSPAD